MVDFLLRGNDAKEAQNHVRGRLRASAVISQVLGLTYDWHTGNPVVEEHQSDTNNC